MSNYSAVAAKIKAMYANAFWQKDFQELISKKSVSEICAYLKNETAYSDVLEGVDENTIHRGRLEELLWVKLDNEYSKIYNFLDDDKKKILNFWFIRHEIEYLKHSIANLYNHESVRNVEPIRDLFLKRTKIDIDKCIGAKSLDDFADACKNTNYYSYLKRVKAINSDYFSIAMGFDLYYYESYYKAIKNLDGKEKQAMEKLIGSQIDMLNIMWIYRSKVYFGFEKEQIYTCLLPVRYKLSEELVKELVNASCGEEIISKLDKTVYKPLFEKRGEGFFPEENYRRLAYRTARLTFQRASDTIAGSCAYIDMKEFEILNIIRVTEGIRYNMNPEVLKNHLEL